ncbi:hypothetical protein CK203_093437 [Vitis vinifera]|uniref:Uncharacterized protein n=1 Tax=Vitis vinifera TaxID=29760 RepID=A0A438CJA0_VITVI|nr:hypothetical protein CK203_093437 [Vitis vinifera]
MHYAAFIIIYRSSSKNYMPHPKGQGLQILDIVDEHVEAEIRFIGPRGKLTLEYLDFRGQWIKFKL